MDAGPIDGYCAEEFRSSEVSRVLSQALRALRDADGELAQLQTLRNGAEALTRLGDDGSDPIGDLSDVAIDSHGLSPRLVQSAISSGVEQGMLPKSPPISTADPSRNPSGTERTDFYKGRKPGAADVALKPNASKAILRLDEWLKRDLELQGKPKTRIMGLMQGLIISGAGTLRFALLSEDGSRELARWDIDVMLVGQPRIDLVSNPASGAGQ